MHVTPPTHKEQSTPLDHFIPRMPLKTPQVLLNPEYKRDTYGFTVRPQYLVRFQEYTGIYKEEEEERLEKWKSFLEQQAESNSENHSFKEITKPVDSDITNQPSEVAQINGERDDSTEQPHVEDASGECDKSSEKRLVSDTEEESVSTREDPSTPHKKSRELCTWAEISPSLNSIECMMSVRVKKRKTMKEEKVSPARSDLGRQVDEAGFLGEESEDDIFYENEIIDDYADSSALQNNASNKLSPEHLFPKEELEFLVHGGIPKDLRGEVWQAFVGVRTRRVERYYKDLLATEIDAGHSKEQEDLLSGNDRTQWNRNRSDVPEKWEKQIEKDLPRTFPGHPALSEKGRNSLRRVLLAYARHNPSIGYCQAMNFFAGLFLLMMPEENAFWTLVGLIDDYFEGYFSQEMIESQVDQLVFEDLMRERFPKLVNHLDYLGVEVAWISGPWFLSIFVNMLPWESVLQVWDVFLFEGNRVMLFRTALALMDLYGPAVVTTKEAGDAITLLQTLAGSTFDSSQLVLTACMGFLTITEDRLQELREKHRPAILVAAEESAKVCRVSKNPKGLATKLYSFKHGPESVILGSKIEAVSSDKKGAGQITSLESRSAGVEEILKGISIDSEVDSAPDLQEQVVWLKAEMCTLLEDKRSAVLRAEELEAAFMELVKQDNRRELSARVEQLEQEISELRQALSDKKEGEKAMLQVLMKVEQEQRVTEDTRRFAEQEVVAQKYAVHVLQEKYETAIASLAQMEKRVVMAETMLEATLQYESGQSKASSSPGPGHVESPQDIPSRRTGLLSFGLGWRDRNKGKSSNESKIEEKGSDTSNTDDQTNGTGRS